MAENKTVVRRPRRQVLLRLGGYLFRYKALVLAALVLTAVSNILALIGPTLSGYAIDAIEPGAGAVQFDRVFYYCGLMAAFYAVSAVLSYALSALMIHLSQKITYQMRREVFEKFGELPVGYFDTHQTGDLISRISYDIDTVNASLSTDLLMICTSVITVTGSFLMMVRLSPPLVSVFFITVPASLLFTRYRTKRVRPLFRRRSAKLGELNGFTEEILSGHKTTKAYHQEATMQARFDAKNHEAVTAYYEADYYGSVTGPSVNFINNISLSLVSVFGAVLYLYGRITLGNISSFVLYSRKFSGPINEAANIFSEMQSALSAADRIFQLLDEAPEEPDAPDAEELTEVRGEVKMEHIRFGYDPERPVIHDLSLTAPAGSTVAIVGHTGAGKTTLINLLMRFYDPQGGRITIDGREIRRLTRSSLRQAYAMVLQDTWLFNGTVFENIAYGKPGATLEEVRAVAKAAHIDGYISRLPDGYDTVLTEDGSNISHGQKQLLTIARAMLLDAKMLILDEATSNVDTRTEQQLQAAMRELMRGKTCFIIAHRLSTIQNADLILVLEGGDIVEQGTHDELMEKGGVYAGLYRSQFR